VNRVVLRPTRARVVVYVCAAAVLVTMVGLAVALPSGGPHGWGVGSRLGVVLLGIAAVYLLHRLASVRVEASDDGILVANVLGRRRLEWAEVVGVRLSRDDPWMLLDLSDGTALAAMGVQKSEGERAQKQAREFARMVQEHTAVPGHD
jgi:Bacterial PH domain